MAWKSTNKVGYAVWDPAMMDIWFFFEGTQAATTWKHKNIWVVIFFGSWDSGFSYFWSLQISVVSLLSFFWLFFLRFLRMLCECFATSLARQAFGKQFCEAFAFYGKHVEKPWFLLISFELHWSPQLGDLCETCALRCLAPALWRQRPFVVLHQLTWVVASKVVNVLMFIEDLPLYILDFVLDQLIFGSPSKGNLTQIGGWMDCYEHQLRMRIELLCLTAVKVPLTFWLSWDKVTWCLSPRTESEFMDVTLIVPGIVKRNAHPSDDILLRLVSPVGVHHKSGSVRSGPASYLRNRLYSSYT